MDMSGKMDDAVGVSKEENWIVGDHIGYTFGWGRRIRF